MYLEHIHTHKNIIKKKNLLFFSAKQKSNVVGMQLL